MSMAHVLIWGLTIGVLPSLAILTDLLVQGVPRSALVAALIFSAATIAFGIALGLMLFGLGITASGCYFAAVRALALRRRIPLRFTRFLERSCDAGVLVRNESVYRFRDPGLQDELARQYRERSAAQSTKDSAAVAQ